MATGGIFQLITNDGKQDKMLMASALLKQRLDSARATRAASGNSDTTPTLYDIERTHILFTNAHFKPFAAIGYEYNKVKPTSGTASLNSAGTSQISFSIPQFGDFFSDMVLHVVMKQPQLTYPSTTAVSDQSLMRWCPYIGERLLRVVDFTVNGNPLDTYTVEATQFHREFCVQPNKRKGWDRCVGQEETEFGWVDQPNWSGSGVPASSVTNRIYTQSSSGLQTPSAQKVQDVELFIPLLFWCNKDPRLAIPSVAIPYGQRYINITMAGSNELVGRVPRGQYQGYTGAWDVNGGALSNIQLANVELYINNIFVNPEVHNIFIKRIGFTLIRVHRFQPISDSTGGVKSQLLQNLKWPIEALFLGMRVNDYYDSGTVQIEKNLDKWYRWCYVDQQSRQATGWSVQQQGNVTTGVTIPNVLTGVTAFTVTAVLGTAITALATGATLVGLLSAGNTLSFTSSTGVLYSWVVDKVTATVATFLNKATASDVLLNTINIVAVPTTASALIVTKAVIPMSSTVNVCLPTLSRVSIKAHGIAIYNEFPVGFYNAYLPYTYGGHNIKTPDDIGAIMITFCLYPGTYQPSGHINVSRAREFYIDYVTTDLVGTSGVSTAFPTIAQVPCTMQIVASAINFLLISDGSAVLRYST
jgi:Large eukaryotic DNA virus major capsid protein/Major capsid protein N-terminus